MPSALPTLRHAVRRLAQAPLFTILAVLTLAPGIRAHVAIFSLVNVLFLRPLPIPDAGRVVGVYQTRNGGGFFPLSLPDSADARSSTRAFSALASHYPTTPLQFATLDGSTEINGSVVSSNYFAVLGIQPALGRFFLPEDEAPGARPCRTRSGGRASGAGRTSTPKCGRSTMCRPRWSEWRRPASRGCCSAFLPTSGCRIHWRRPPTAGATRGAGAAPGLA